MTGGDDEHELSWFDTPERESPAIVPSPAEPDPGDVTERGRRWGVVFDGGPQHAADVYTRWENRWARLQCLGVTVHVDDLFLVTDTEQPDGFTRVCRNPKCQRILRELQKGTT